MDVFRTAANKSQDTDALISWIRVERYNYPKAPSAPYLTSVDTTVANQAKVQFIEAAGAENDKVKYGTSPNVYTNEIVISSGLEKVITGLSAGTPYYFTVTGFNPFGESASSNEVTATTKTEIPTQTPSDLMYYTVLGASRLPEGKSYGWLQEAVIDPTNFPIAKDPTTGYTWGMTNRSTIAGAWVIGPYGGFGYTNNKKAGKGINYSFEVPNGQYNVSWQSSNPAIAAVDSNGIIKAVVNGTAMITATVGGISATCAVIVRTPVTSIQPQSASITLVKGETMNLMTTVLPSNAINKSVIWNSNKSLIASVDANGIVTGKNFGAAIITATSSDGYFEAKFLVKVAATVPLTGVTITPSKFNT